MQPMVTDLINPLRLANPDLLDWQNLDVDLIKDPARPLSQVSRLGVIHAGLEKDSAVYRLSDANRCFILKHHLARAPYVRESANISFVNAVGRIAPELLYADDDAQLILMEDLGDRSLAVLWHHQAIAEYSSWVRRAITILAQVQAYFAAHQSALADLYSQNVPERHEQLPLPGGLADTVDEILQISRGTCLQDTHRLLLAETDLRLRAKITAFNKRHRTFRLDLTPWHVIEKQGHIRILDLTGPPVGGLLCQFNLAWHLDDRAEILEFYLAERRRLGLPPINTDQFLWLEDAIQLLESVEWIRNYCRQILEGQHSFTNLDGSQPADYEASEKANLHAIHRAVEPHEDLRTLTDVLDQYLRVPLKR